MKITKRNGSKVDYELRCELYLWGETLDKQDEERKEEIIDILNAQKEDIEHYFGVTLEELLKTI